MNPLLSIVIPTKDRYATLFPVVEVLLKYIEGTDYEIVIQDNSIENHLAEEKIQMLNDSRIKYFYSSLPISVSENSNLAISNSSGQYITFIGDDDLVSPYILKIISAMTESGMDCLVYNIGNYYWKDLIFNKKYMFHAPATLQYPKKPSLSIKKMYSDQELKKVLESGGVAIYDLPKLYHGIVKREIMILVNEKFGSYVPGSCPDMALAIALSCVVKEYGYMNYPVTVTGASRKSAGGMGLRGEHIAKIEDISWLPKNTINIWDNNIPRIWTGPTIYAQNIHEVFLQTGSEKTINYEKLYSYMYVKDSMTKNIVYPFLLSVHNNNLKKLMFFSFTKFKSLAYIFLQKSPAFIINMAIFFRGDFKNKVHIKNIESVEVCMQHLLKNIQI